jgi:hypothetical protein
VARHSCKALKLADSAVGIEDPVRGVASGLVLLLASPHPLKPETEELEENHHVDDHEYDLID